MCLLRAGDLMAGTLGTKGAEHMVRQDVVLLES